MAKYCRFTIIDGTSSGQGTSPTTLAAASKNCYGCGQPGHIFKECPRGGRVENPPPAKRQAIASRVFAAGDREKVELTDGTYFFFLTLGAYIYTCCHLWLSCIVKKKNV